VVAITEPNTPALTSSGVRQFAAVKRTQGKSPVTTQPQTGSLTSASMAKVKSTMQYVGFRLADQEYAFRIEHIQEIVIPDRVTRIPQVPDYVEGVSNLRGAIIPIVKLRRLFALEPKEKDEETRTIVANVGAKTIGCTVDSVTQVMRISPEQIQPAPDIVRSEEASYITGFAKIDTRIVVLLDIQELLDPTKLEQVRQIAIRGVALTGSE
jgi:purine-binding chemotaxis protein CheW